MSELEFMKLAIEEAKKCIPEDDRIHPMVGAVVVKDGVILASGFRGEKEPGDHAEFTVLEKKLKEVNLAGAIVYTTLEPCTKRKPPKRPCVERLVERKVAQVVIGSLDPNPIISGKGALRLRDANIEISLFPKELMAEIEDLDREYIRYQSQKFAEDTASTEFLRQIRGRSLDEWYMMINEIYWNGNYHRDSDSLFVHLVEVVGGLSLLASQKKKNDLLGDQFVSKALAWWMALCGKAGVRSISDMIWAKFPFMCPYCQKQLHDEDECSERKALCPVPDWGALKRRGEENIIHRPSSLGDWQKMFSSIYPAQQMERYEPTFARLIEELGELAEAVRVFQTSPGYFLNEAADVFAWLMHIQNLIEKNNKIPRERRGELLERDFGLMYPNRCKNCNRVPCICPPILESTIGRIANEFFAGEGQIDGEHGFLTKDMKRILNNRGL